MSKRITIDETTLNAMVQEFKELVRSSMNVDGKIELSHKMPEDNKSASLLITPLAYAKMEILIKKFSTEVAWHGLVQQLSETTWVVYDVLVYPHVVGNTTVTADYEEYQQWLDELDDETFSALRFHGHSHVNMDVTPSGLDKSVRCNIIKQMLHKSGFYVFMIANKRDDFSAEIYDITNNASYSTADKSLSIQILLDDDYTSGDFINHAKLLAKEPKKIEPITTKKQNDAGDVPWFEQKNGKGYVHQYPYDEIFGD